MKATRQYAHRSTALLLTVVGMAGIPGLFLPFTYGASPVMAIADREYWRLGLPFFLAVPASAGSVRWIISRSFSVTERAIAYIASAAMAAVTLSVGFALSEGWPKHLRDWVVMLGPEAILALGVYLLIRNSKMGPSREFNPVMAIQTAYIAHGALCFIAFFGDWQRGAYCVLIAALAFALQIILTSKSEPDAVKS